jgi:hypothetical protein
VIINIKVPAELKLAKVVSARDVLRLALCLAEHRQEHRRQYGDDGGDHEQFDQ